MNVPVPVVVLVTFMRSLVTNAMTMIEALREGAGVMRMVVVDGVN